MKMNETRIRPLVILGLITVLCGMPIGVRTSTLNKGSIPTLSSHDSTLISEAYHLWQTLGEKVWTGWTSTQMGLVYITPNYEYAINFEKDLTGFTPVRSIAPLNAPIQGRKRTLDPNLSASFDFENVPSVVMGTDASLELGPEDWVLTAVHEMFHVLQSRRGEEERVSRLGLGSQSDAGWQLNYPFPYENSDVMRLIHLQGYLSYLAVKAVHENDMKYDCGTAADAIRVYKNTLYGLSKNDNLYKYSQFQEWTEGIALYTEYQMAKAAAGSHYRPIRSFLRLTGYKGYKYRWSEKFENHLYLVKHAGRAAQSRVAFYHLGLGKGLLLDRLMPDWKTRYFAPGVWLNNLVFEALGLPTDTKDLLIGDNVPDFQLLSLTGETVSPKNYAGGVVLINFMQAWCVPCVEEIPHLLALDEKYRKAGLTIIGISDRLDPTGVKTLRNLIRDNKVNYVVLDDRTGSVAAQYSVSGYPSTFVIGRDGRLIYRKRGYNRGDEAEIENSIVKGLHVSD